VESADEFRSTLHEWMGLFLRRSMRDLVLHSRDLGLSMSQMGVLFHIHRKGICSVSDIGDDLGTSHAAASQMVDRLVQMGFVERTEDPDDRRAKRIALSEKGMGMLRRSMYARLGWLDEVAQALTPQEREQVDRALKTLIARAYQLDPMPHPDLAAHRDAHSDAPGAARDPQMTGDHGSHTADRADHISTVGAD